MRRSVADRFPGEVLAGARLPKKFTNLVLTVPNFSTPVLPPDLGLPPGVHLHYARGDADHGRSVVAFSGEPRRVLVGLYTLAARVLPTIDLSTADGVHPRIGALDVVPFIDLRGDSAATCATRFANRLERAMAIPTRLYERSSPTGENLPTLRRQTGEGHPRWGRTVVGARDFLIAANLDFSTELRSAVRAAAREMRRRREAGDSALAGVRVLPFDLESRGLIQLSFNLTEPDRTSFDLVAAIGEELIGAGATGTELIGVIRRRDLPRSTRLDVDPAQIVD